MCAACAETGRGSLSAASKVFSASRVREVAPICDRIVSSRAPAEGPPFGVVREQLHQGQRQLRQTHDPHRVAALKQGHNVAEIFRVVSGHDGHAVLRRLDNVVPAARHQASADESHIGQSIERGQFSDGIDQQHSARQRFSLPLRAPERRNAQLPQQDRNVVEALGMPRRQNHHRARMRHPQIFKRLQQRRFLVLHRAAADQHRSGAFCRQRSAQALDNGRRRGQTHVELQIPRDLHASASAPIDCSRALSSCVCARNRSTCTSILRRAQRKRR